MTNLEIVKEKLYKTNASLVVLFKNGDCKEYYHRRVEDIVTILKENKDALNGATIADKVIGKVAGSILTVAGVKEIYADVMSKYAIPVLEENHIKYEYKTLTEYVINNSKTGMCPMENKYKDEKDIYKIYDEMIRRRKVKWKNKQLEEKI